jgi:molybdopterin converting factor subunit 1
MTVRVRLFAILKDRAGVEQAELELPDGASVGDAVDAVARRYASLSPLLARTAAAVNRAYARRDDALSDGDELALIPPVSGG